MQLSAQCLRRFFACVVFALVSATAGGIGHAQSAEYQLKAAKIFRIIKYIEWPEKRLKADSPLVIGVFGQDTMLDRLGEAVVSQQHQGRAIVIKRITALPEIEGCHLLFVGRSQDANVRSITRRVVVGTVTVGESETFVTNGGMFLLQPDSGSGMRIRTLYDKGNFKRSKLKLQDEATEALEEIQ